MKRLSTFLLFVTLFASCTSGGQDDGFDDKEKISISGLYESDGTFLYLYPDQTGVEYRSYDPTIFTWSLGITQPANVYLESRGDSLIIEGRVYEKRYHHNSVSVDRELVGRWELEHVKRINPIISYESVGKFKYNNSAEVKEVDVMSVKDYVNNTAYWCKTFTFSNDNVVKCEYVSFSAIIISNDAVHTYASYKEGNTTYYYNTDYMYSDYKTANGEILNYKNYTSHYYKINGSKLTLEFLIDDRGSQILYSCTYHRIS